MCPAQALTAPAASRAAWPAPRIGIDFDNTLIDYDRVFVAAAIERDLIAPGFCGSKRAVRDAIRLLPDGEIEWQRLQGHVYGAGIAGAVPFDGAGDFLRRCHARGLDVFIVSHKTRYGHLDPARVDLRRAATEWMAARGFFAADGFGLRPDRVFFEDTRRAKLARVAALGCSHFIDDLEEVFADPDFPPGVARILFAASGDRSTVTLCPSWRDITAAVLG